MSVQDAVAGSDAESEPEIVVQDEQVIVAAKKKKRKPKYFKSWDGQIQADLRL